MDEIDARVEAAGSILQAESALRALGDLIEIEPARVTVQDCVAPTDGKHLGSGRVVHRCIYRVVLSGAQLDPCAVETMLRDAQWEVTAKESTVVADLVHVTATRRGTRLTLAFWEPSGNLVRVDVTAESPCVEGLA